MDINALVVSINNVIWNPMLLYIIAVAVILTLSLGFLQFRYFFTSWKHVLAPQAGTDVCAEADMTPMQAFINALSASIGNGTLAGIATAVYSGGPGAAFWVFVFGFLGMILRFAEVFLSAIYPPEKMYGLSVGGPMVYLKNVPGRTFLPFVYTLFLLFLGLTSGCGMQANSVTQGIVHILGIQKLPIALALFVFALYIMLGGAKRIVQLSNFIVPIKVIGFFGSMIFVLLYHASAIPAAFKTILQGAFNPSALMGGVLGYTMIEAMRFGFARTALASEAGLGSAGVLFGNCGNNKPFDSGIMSMSGAFISTNLVCFLVSLVIVASGVWTSGKTGIDLTIASYETVYGWLGGWIITLLSISFGLGVLVAYAYIGRACWIYLTGGRQLHVFTALFCIVTFLGAMSRVELVWNLTDLITAGLLLINLFALVWLLPVIKAGITKAEKENHKIQ